MRAFSAQRMREMIFSAAEAERASTSFQDE
jgi:hypothetical protein